VDEVVAATFAIAWKKFDLVANPSLPWLYRIATFEILHDYRRQSREGEQIPLADIELTDDFPLDDALSITGAFAQLSQSDQELLRLLYWDDLRRDEIAVVLGCSMGTLNVRVHRAMERLRAFLVETSSLSDHADKPHHVPEEE